MIARLVQRLRQGSLPVRRDAVVLMTMHGIKSAWVEARKRRYRAQSGARWHDSELMRMQARHWDAVMREIERQTGRCQQSETPAPHRSSGAR